MGQLPRSFALGWVSRIAEDAFCDAPNFGFGSFASKSVRPKLVRSTVKSGKAEALSGSASGRYCCKSPRGAARPGKFGNNRIRIAGSVNQNSRFDPWARKLFFVPAPKIVLQQYRPISAVTHTQPPRQLSGAKLPLRQLRQAAGMLASLARPQGGRAAAGGC